MRSRPDVYVTRPRRLALLLALVLLASLVIGVTLAAAVAPTVTVEDASQVEYTTADVEGTIDPQGESTTYRFQYVTEAQFQENLTNGVPAFEGAATQIEGSTETAGQVSGELVGLQPGTTFHLRLSAENSDGPSEAVAGATFATKAVAKPVVTIATPAAVTGTSAHFEGTVDPDGTDPAFNTRWRFRCEPGCPGLGEGEVPADTSTHSVSAEAEGLQPNTTYEVFLVAENAGGATEAGPVSTRTALVGPTVTTTAAFTPAGGTEAQLGGLVNPENSPTTYYFEYGTDTSYGNRVPSARGVEAGPGGEPVAVGQTAAGLSPETTYHYRLVAENEDAAGPARGQDKTFVTGAAGDAPTPENCPNSAIRIRQHATFLPDCRAWEMVSPVDKAGNDVQLGEQNPTTLTVPTGEAVTFSSLGAFGGIEGSSGPQLYLARRDQGGWVSQGLSPQTKAGFNNIPALTGFSADLSETLLSSNNATLAPGALAGARNVYLRNNVDNSYTLVATGTPGSASLISHPQAFLDDATPDFSTFIFESNDQLLPNAIPGTYNVYESSHGRLSLASELPGEVPPPEGAYVGGNATTVPPGKEAGAYTEGSLSENGSRVVFTDKASRQIYLREDGGPAVDVSASQRSSPDPAGTQPATWLASTADGSQVFFKSSEKLTDNSNASVDGSEPQLDLYRYDVDTGKLTDLTAGSEPGGVQGLMAVSDDGSYVYFAANAELAEGAQPGDCSPTLSGTCTLYVWHQGSPLKVVGRVNGGVPAAGPSDSAIWTENSSNGEQKAAAVTSNGEIALFVSRARQTGYANEGHREVYRYEALSNRLSCISCDRTGVAARSEATFNLVKGNIAYALPARSDVLADGGDRVFFTSEESLSRQDSNGRADVYEWETQGTGTCVVAGGCLALISSGSSADESGFGTATPTGGDAFFATRQQLVGIDIDHNTDLYDARENGGIGAQDQTSATAPCEGETCRGAAEGAPTAAPAASSTIAGPPDVKPHRKKRHKRAPKRKLNRGAKKKHRAKIKGKKSSTHRKHG